MTVIEPDALEAHLGRIRDDGWTVLPDAIEPALLDELDEVLDRLERDLGAAPAANVFEGHATVRIYNLLARDRVFERVPVHPAVLPVVQGVIGEGCLV